jgi:DNA-binding transcriptional LysR family regulator
MENSKYFRRLVASVARMERGAIRVVACTKAGLGIALASRSMCRAELEAGELVAILSNYQLDLVELHAVYPGGRRPSLKARAFCDYFAAQLMHKDEGG